MSAHNLSSNEVGSIMHTGSLTSGPTPSPLTTRKGVNGVKGILLKSNNSNAGNVYVGGPGVTMVGTDPTSDGIELAPGQSITIPLADPRDVYVVSAAAQILSWMVN